MTGELGMRQWRGGKSKLIQRKKQDGVEAVPGKGVTRRGCDAWLIKEHAATISCASVGIVRLALEQDVT